MKQNVQDSALWCKICGITTAEDAAVAEAAGADAIGLNFFRDSPRHVSAQRAEALTRGIRLTRVGLFVDHTAAEVEAVLAACTLDMLQFSGNEPEVFCSSFGLPYLKTVHVKPGDTVIDVGEHIYSSAWGLLLDTFVPGVAGGTGRSFDWSLWPAGQNRRLIVAGGLTPENVAQAIVRTAPFGVDVASGVEGAVKGQKDPAKVRAFVQTVKDGKTGN